MIFYIAGFPGSGNRFFTIFLESITLKTTANYFQIEYKPQKPILTNHLHNTFRFKYIIKEGEKVIHLIRNPLDAIYSRIHNSHGYDDAVEDKYNIDKTLSQYQRYAHSWNCFVDEGIKLRNNPNYLEIRYEDICLKQKETLKRICKFLEIECDEKKLTKLKNRALISINKHENFNEKEINDIKDIIKINMKKFGYS